MVSKRNKDGTKDSINCYRNIIIHGRKIFFELYTSDSSVFQIERFKAKKLGLKTRVINGEFYRELTQSKEGNNIV